MCQHEGIVKVKSLHRMCEGDDAVNDLLEQGWVLLEIKIIEHHDPKDAISASIVYVLGRKEEREE